MGEAQRLEYWVLIIAAGVAALHVADDSFLQPQPGTSAGDHLVSGRCLWQPSRWS